mmetsp:Transcript_95435/g.227315  ORF Transcript_95435/g.227315 Transcript_95435/m.227315 type:complete len:255 (-) Transcript_95435:233-997(-)
MSEGVNQQMQLISQVQQNPILVYKAEEKRSAISDVHHIFDLENIDVVIIELFLILGFFGILLFTFVHFFHFFHFCIFLALLFVRLFLFLFPSFLELTSLYSLADLALLLFPLRQLLLPTLQPLSKPARRNEILYPHGLLVLQHPVAHDLVALLFRLPNVPDLVKAFVFSWNAVVCKAFGKRARRQIRRAQFPEPLSLLLFVQLKRLLLLKVLLSLRLLRVLHLRVGGWLLTCSLLTIFSLGFLWVFAVSSLENL